MGILENLGLVAKIDTSEMRDLLNEFAANAPDISVENIPADDAITGVYAQGDFNPDVDINRLSDFIETLPDSLPDAVKQVSVGGILKASGISIQNLIDDGKTKLQMIDVAKHKAQVEHDDLCANVDSDISKLNEMIEAAKKTKLDSQTRVAQLNAAFDAETVKLSSLLAFANGVVNVANPQMQG